jgi:adenylyl cyclase-associated protein
MQVQVLGTCPTVSVDKTDGFQLYLSAESLATQIVTAKSSEMNILIPGGPDGDMIELPVPEQFKTVVKGGKLHTDASEIAG